VHGSLATKYLGWAKTFVHPFITDVPGRPATDPRYQLVMQYWFFYPYNDAGNIHEGDWEHINVVVTSKEQGAEPFTAEQMRTWLANPPSTDDLVIREIQYYFHHWVFRLDYWSRTSIGRTTRGTSNGIISRSIGSVSGHLGSDPEAGLPGRRRNQAQPPSDHFHRGRQPGAATAHRQPDPPGPR
jgi:hypothetical protein